MSGEPGARDPVLQAAGDEPQQPHTTHPPRPGQPRQGGAGGVAGQTRHRPHVQSEGRAVAGQSHLYDISSCTADCRLETEGLIYKSVSQLVTHL